MATKTGGRAAATRHIAPRLALAVGKPSLAPPTDWQWRPLADLARLESGHTPSRRHPEYWGGDVPWISIPDAKVHHGGVIANTAEMTNELGIANSSARTLPTRTVCLSRTASVGYVVVTARPMATSQDFVNWICGDELEPEFLQYLLIAEGNELLRFSSGAIHKTIYFPEVKAFHVCVPVRVEQRRIVAILDEAFKGIATAKANTDRCLRNAQSLAQSRIDSVFTNRSQTWPESPLESVADFVNGYAFKSADFGVMSGVRSIKITNVGVGQFVAGEDNRLPAHFAQTHAASMAKAGSIVLALTRTIIAGGVKVAVVPQAYDGALVNQRVAAIAPREQMLLTPFLFLFLSSQRVAQYVKDRVNTLMQPNLSIADLRTLQVPIPALSEQRVLMHQLAEFQCEARRLAHVYARKLAALDELKKSLLHRAFTGAL